MKKTLRAPIARSGHSTWVLAHLLLLASGMAALMHQLLWTRRLVDLLGASAESLTRVFGSFFLGLALGAAVTALCLPRIKNPGRAAGWCEVLIGVFALPALLLTGWMDWIWPALGPDGMVTWKGAAIKLLVAAVTIVPPAFCMGTILPLVIGGLPGSVFGRRLVSLYAINTLGGALGLLGVVGLALPVFGSNGAMMAAILINIAAGLGFLALFPRDSRSDSTPSPASDRLPSSRKLPWGLLAFFSGAGVLAAEVVITQSLMLVAPFSFYAPAAILFAVIFVLALAAFASSWLQQFEWDSSVLLARAMSVTAFLFVLGAIAFMAIVQETNPFAVNATVGTFFAKLAILVVVTFGPGFFAAGLVFPILLAGITPAQTRERRIAGILALNGLGGLFGAEIAVRGLLPMFGLYPSLGVIALSYAGVALAIGIRARAILWPAAVGLLIWGMGLPALKQLPTVNTRVGLTVLDERIGREGSVAVIENDVVGRGILLSNQYLLGGSNARWYQERQGHLPLLLHPAPRDVAFIGLATGITPGAALAHSQIDSITAIELSPLVARAAKEYFGEYNRGVSEASRVRTVVEDGRTFLASCEGRFDVIVGDLFHPWGPGEGRLYSLEHFRDVRRALRPGGLFCQWLPMYQLTPEQFETIAATFQKIFPRTQLFTNGFTSDNPALALVGTVGETPSWEQIARRVEEGRSSGEITDPVLRHVEGLAMLSLGEYQSSGNERLNTLGNLAIELDAGKQRISGSPGVKYFYGTRWLAFCRELRGKMDGHVPEDRIRAGEIADLCQQFEFALRQDRRAAGDLQTRISDRMPAALKTDIGAKKEAWSGSVIPWR